MNVELEHIVCLLCGADSPELIVIGHDSQLGLPGAFPLGQCRRCGLVYLVERPHDLARYYGQGYLSHQRAARSPLQRARAALQRQQIAAYVQRTTGLAAGRVLDVGCGTGVFLGALQQAGWDVWGVEPGAEAARIARELLGPQVLHGALEAVDLPQRSFNLVTLWDVVEHLPDPATTLRQISGLLAPGGVVLLQTPRWGCVESRIFGAAWCGLDPPRHLAVFSGATLQRLLRESGFATHEVPALASGFQHWALSLRYALAQRLGSQRAAQLYHTIASPPLRVLSLPLISVLDKGRVPAQLAMVAAQAQP